jgi:hypothetical protein
MGESTRVLVVGDEILPAETLSDLLPDEAFQVAGPHSNRKAVRCARATAMRARDAGADGV